MTGTEENAMIAQFFGVFPALICLKAKRYFIHYRLKIRRQKADNVFEIHLSDNNRCIRKKNL